LAKARWLEARDLPAVKRALQASHARMRAAGREWSKHLNVATALEQLQEECGLVVVGDYMVAFQINGGWFMPDAKFMQEVIVLRITHHVGNSLRNVVREMERIARLNDCVGIYVGTYGADDERLGRTYQQLGFRAAPMQLYKEI